MKLATPILAALPALIAVPCSAIAQESISLDGLFPKATAPMEVALQEGESQMTVMELVRSYEMLTGQHFILNQETTNILENSPIGMTGGFSVPASEVQNFFELVLSEHNFLLHILRPKAPRVLSLISLHTGARNTARNQVMNVDISDIDRVAQHPAMLFQTVVTLPNTDVRQLTNTMRTMITDANIQQMLPAGSSNSVVLVGKGPQLASLVSTFRRVDTASATPGPAAKPQKPEPQFEVVKMQYAQAMEIANIVMGLVVSAQEPVQQQHPGSAQSIQPAPIRPQVAPDARTNSLLLMGLPQDMERMKRVIALLDREAK